MSATEAIFTAPPREKGTGKMFHNLDNKIQENKLCILYIVFFLFFALLSGIICTHMYEVSPFPWLLEYIYMGASAPFPLKQRLHLSLIIDPLLTFK